MYIRYVHVYTQVEKLFAIVVNTWKYDILMAYIYVTVPNS